VIHSVTAPLRQIQAEWWNAHVEAQKEYGRSKEESELRHMAWREKYKAQTKKGLETPYMPEDEPEQPVLRRIIVNDATFESLHETMKDNPAGVLVIFDELTGWLSQMDRPGREGERAFYLQAWNGDTGYTIDRIGRGTIHVEACCLSLLGGIQPARLRSYLVDAVKDGPNNDGLMQRFQLLVWPDTSRDWRYVDRPPNPASEEEAACVFRRLVQLIAENPVRFRFDPDAQELFVEWSVDLERKIRIGDDHPALISHLSKYRKLMPALALNFELADCGVDTRVNATVSLEHAQQAVGWCEYLESHARRIYSCLVPPRMRAARELADKIKQRKVGANGFFASRDVYLKGWSGLDSPESMRQAAEVLQDAGWIREAPVDAGPFGGRPPIRYQLNPRVWE
jgi:putative DNA primase/helicase